MNVSSISYGTVDVAHRAWFRRLPRVWPGATRPLHLAKRDGVSVHTTMIVATKNRHVVDLSAAILDLEFSTLSNGTSEFERLFVRGSTRHYGLSNCLLVQR